MFISIQALEDKPLEFREEFRPQALDLGPEVEQQTPLATSGRAELLEEHEGAHQVVQDIRVVGGFSTRIAVKCARCLEPVSSDLKGSFDLLYRPRGIEKRGPESSISEAETEIGFGRVGDLATLDGTVDLLLPIGQEVRTGTLTSAELH